MYGIWGVFWGSEGECVGILRGGVGVGRIVDVIEEGVGVSEGGGNEGGGR